MSDKHHRYYKHTKFRQNPRGDPKFFVDLTWNDPYSLVLSKRSHIIVMYQYAGYGGGTAPGSHFVTRLSINSVLLKHTATHSADTTYVGNFGMWQGPLSSGTHKLTLEYRTPKAGTNHPEHTDWQTRTMTIISCS